MSQLYTVFIFIFFFFNDTATTEIYTLSLHDALPIYVTQNDDMSIRDSAGSCLLAIVKTVARDGNKKEFNELILSCVVPACKLALRSNNEVMINHY